MEIIIEDANIISASLSASQGMKSQSNPKYQKKLSFTPTQASESKESSFYDYDNMTIQYLDDTKTDDLSITKELHMTRQKSSSAHEKTIATSFRKMQKKFPGIIESLKTNFSNNNNYGRHDSDTKVSSIRHHSNDNVQQLRNEILCKTKEDLNNPIVNRLEDFEKMTNIQEINNFKEYTRECMKMIGQMTVPDDCTLQNCYINLPFANEIGYNKKRLAVFDLDETLVHSELKDIHSAQRIIEVVITSSMRKTIGLNIRPRFKEELTKLKENYYLVVYTASQQRYADAVLDILDPENELFSYRLYRNNCTLIKVDNQVLYVKDLRIFKNISMSDMVIIDNSILSFAFHLNNGIPILPYYEGDEDDELSDLRMILDKLATKPDVRTKLQCLMNLEETVEKFKEEEDLETIDELENSNGSHDINDSGQSSEESKNKK